LKVVEQANAPRFRYKNDSSMHFLYELKNAILNFNRILFAIVLTLKKEKLS